MKGRNLAGSVAIGVGVGAALIATGGDVSTGVALAAAISVALGAASSRKS